MGILDSIRAVVETINGTYVPQGKQEQEDWQSPDTEECRVPEAQMLATHELPTAEYPK